MAFVKNTYQQLSFTDTLTTLNERELKKLEKSWAKTFGDVIFPKIDETRFAGLYSEKISRPNTPVNIVVGGLLLERLLDLTDEELIVTMNFDARFQYALHTTAYDVQPFSTNTFRRFRVRNEEYRARTGTDLLEDYLQELIHLVASNQKLKPLMRRIRQKKN
jgi:hypothetical protein